MDKRRHPRSAPPASEQLLTLHDASRNAFGRAIDESKGGLGVHLAEEFNYSVGDRVLVHRLDRRQLMPAVVRHVSRLAGRGMRIGLEWNDR